MTREEFIGSHGREAYEALVAPLERLACGCTKCSAIRRNAVDLVDVLVGSGSRPTIRDPHDRAKLLNGPSSPAPK